MNSRIITVVSALLLMTVASLCDAAASADPAIRQFTKRISIPKRIGYTLRIEYQISFPQSFKPGEKKLPCIVFLHGEGVNPDSGLPLLQIPALLALAKDSAVILAPRCASGQTWLAKNTAEAVTTLLDSLKGSCGLDTGRIYLVGWGDGAAAAYQFAARYPALFAGLVAINGQGRAENAWMHKHVPAWIVHGAAQKNRDNAETMALALEVAGGTVKKTIPADSTAPLFTAENLGWLLRTTRGANPVIDSSARSTYAVVQGPTVVCLNPFHSDASAQRIDLQIGNKASMPVRVTVKLDPSKQFSTAPQETMLTVAGAAQGIASFTIKKAVKEPLAVAVSWSAVYEIGAQKRTITRTGAIPVALMPTYVCARVTHAVVVDGDIGEWKNLPLTIAKTAETGNSIRFAAAYDSLNWYAAIDVVDDDVVLDPAKFVWEQDGIELRLDARENTARIQNRGDGEMRDFLLIGTSPARDDSSEAVLFQKEQLPAGVTVKCVRTAKGFSAEIAVPVAYLNEKQKQPWSGFRLNLALNDVDGTKPKAGYWFCPDWRSKENVPGSGTFVKK